MFEWPSIIETLCGAQPASTSLLPPSWRKSWNVRSTAASAAREAGESALVFVYVGLWPCAFRTQHSQARLTSPTLAPTASPKTNLSGPNFFRRVCLRHLQHAHEPVGNRQHAAGLRLRPLSPDRQLPSIEVDVAPRRREQLALPTAETPGYILERLPSLSDW
jgi:hypothetical protein